MLRLLAVALVLAVVAGLPSTTHAGAIAGDTDLRADEPSGSEDAEDAQTPQPPPSDAILLAVDAEPHEARIDELYEVDWYRFVASEGQDYWIVADTSREGSGVDVDIVVSLHDGTGTPVEVARENHHNELRWLLLTDADAGTYFVRVGVDPIRIVDTGAYGIEVRAIDDDHGNSAAEGTVIDLASALEYGGRMDYEDDQDWLVFDARAGDIYRLTATGLIDAWLHSVRAAGDGDGVEVDRLERWGTSGSMSGPDPRPWHFEESGRYAVAVRDEAGRQNYPGDYTLTFERLTDDHSNTPDVTGALSVGRETVAVLDYRGDEDWFGVDLVDGNQYVVEVSSPDDEAPSLEVVVYGVDSTMYTDSYARDRHRLSYPGSSRLLWTVIGTGRHRVQVRDTSRWDSTIHPASYGITVNRRAPPDDHADQRDGSTPLRPGVWLEGTLDTLGDEDWFRLSAAAGVPYTVEYEIRGEGSEDFGPPEDFYDGNDVVVYFLDDDWGFSGAAGYAFPTAGTQHVLVTTAEWADGRPWDYRLRLVEHERVDHGDDRRSAGALAPGEAVVGSATSADPDWFYFEAPEPGVYAISGTRSGSGAFGVAVLDGSAELPRPIPSFGSYEQGSLVTNDFFSIPAAGRYWIRITAKWAAPYVYGLSVERQAIEADDHADEAAGATPVPLAPPEPGQEPSEETVGATTETTTTEGPVGVTHGQASGRLESYGDVDVFALELRRGVKYRITPSATRPAPPGTHYPGYNREVGVSLRDGDTSVGSRESWGPRIEYLPTVTGTYHVRVAYGEGGPFLEPRPYSFEVEVLPPDEQPDLLEDAAPVDAGARIIGMFENRGDLDWFRFSATRGQTWILQSPRERWGCAEILDIAEGNRILKDCTSDRVLWTIPSDGDYVIKVFVESPYGWRSPGVEYDLTLSIVPLDDHGNSRDDASALITGEPQDGQIDYIGDTDVFRLDSAEGEFWDIEMTRSYYGTSYGTEFVPSDPESATPETWDRLNVGSVLAAPTDGHWLISIGGARSSGDYTISASRTELSDDYGSNRAAAHALEAPLVDPACEHSAETCPGTIVVEGVLNHRFDSDYFRLPLVAGGRYEFRVRSSSDGVIFTLLTSEHCALRGPTTWEKSYDTWIPDATGDHWIRVGSKRLIDDPVTYTLEVTARSDDFLTLTERATELEPNVVHEVGDEGDGGNNLYWVRFDHPRYVIEVTGGPSAWGTSPGEQFGGSYVDEDDRYLYQIPSNPPVEYQFRVRGGAGTPYTVVARERVPADESLDWWSVHMSPGFPPDYCRRAGG